MNILLGIANAALQYHRGRKTGLAGIIGIALSLLIVAKWKYILPILEALGVVSFLKRIGLIYKGDPALTGLNIFWFIFKLCILLCVILFVLLVIGIILSMLFTSETFLLKIFFPIFFVIASPIIIPYMVYLLLTSHKRPSKTDEIKEYPQDELLREYSEEITKEQALIRLNRLPTKGDNLFLLGKTSDDKLYMLLPRPVDVDDFFKYKTGDLAGVHFTVEKDVRTVTFDVDNRKIRCNLPEKFKINRIYENEIEAFPSERIISFYQTHSEEMLDHFKGYGLSKYEKYVKEIQDYYFSTKETLINTLKIITEKERVDNILNRLALFNAPNEDIVKMMLDSEERKKI